METTETLESFFFDQVDAALREQRVEADPLTEHYLVRLLSGFAARPLDDQALGPRLLAALEAAPTERRRQLREVGDTSLYVSGFFTESFSRRVVDVEYYMDLGCSAYGELARTSEGWSRDPMGSVYEALSARFARFVEVLALVSRRTLPTEPRDVVRLYDRYRATTSPFVARQLASELAALGVLPQDGAGEGRPQ
jgi:hypothetical protein